MQKLGSVARRLLAELARRRLEAAQDAMADHARLDRRDGAGPNTSGRSSCRLTPVTRSTAKANSAATRPDFSQRQTFD